MLDMLFTLPIGLLVLRTISKAFRFTGMHRRVKASSISSLMLTTCESSGSPPPILSASSTLFSGDAGLIKWSNLSFLFRSGGLAEGPTDPAGSGRLEFGILISASWRYLMTASYT